MIARHRDGFEVEVLGIERDGGAVPVCVRYLEGENTGINWWTTIELLTPLDDDARAAFAEFALGG